VEDKSAMDIKVNVIDIQTHYLLLFISYLELGEMKVYKGGVVLKVLGMKMRKINKNFAGKKL
jgi:hypothetical protein